MKLITILLSIFSISVVNAVKPNIFFNFINITSVGRILQISYKINPYKGTSNPLIIDKAVDIIMIDYFSLKKQTIAAKKIFFNDKKTGALITDASMTSKSGSDGIKFIFSFQLRNSYQNISKPLEGLDMMLHAKIFVMKANFKNNSIKSNETLKELQIYTEMEAYLKICTKYFEDFESICENILEFSENYEHSIFLYLMIVFIIGMAVSQVSVIILQYCFCKCSKIAKLEVKNIKSKNINSNCA
jgi:hypothetical protein